MTESKPLTDASILRTHGDILARFDGKRDRLMIELYRIADALDERDRRIADLRRECEAGDAIIEQARRSWHAGEMRYDSVWRGLFNAYDAERGKG